MSRVIASALFLLASSAAVLGQKPLSDWNTGILTNYGGAQDGMDPYNPSFGTSVGSCGYGVLDKNQYPFWSVAALSTSSPFYKKGPVNGCGQCFQVQCVDDGPQFQGRCNEDPAQRSVTVMITDACPECAENHMDMQALTFNKIAPMSIGRVWMKYRQVECAPPADLQIKVDQNGGAGAWIRLMVEEAAGVGAVKTVQLKGQNSDWQGMKNIWGAAWELSNSPQPPLDLRVVAADGQEVTAFGCIDANGQTGSLPTGVQFSYGKIGSSSGDGAASTASASASASSGSSSEPLVSAFSGPEDESSASQPSGDDVVPCITAFQGTTVDPTNCANSGSGAGRTSSGPAAASSSGPAAASSSGSAATPQSSSTTPPSGVYLRGQSSASQASTGSDSCMCDDQSPPGGYSCDQQKSFGACSQQWMWQWTPDRPKGYCAKTCGFCKC